MRRFDGDWWAYFARHYLRDMVFAANDGLVTTFAVVAGVRGAGFSPLVVMALGFANIAADGISMAAGNYLGVKSERECEMGSGFLEWEESVHAAKHGVVTWFAFVVAGLLPLGPFLLGSAPAAAFAVSTCLTLAGLFGVGAVRGVVTGRAWWRTGLEVLAVGLVAGAAAFGAGLVVERVTAGAGRLPAVPGPPSSARPAWMLGVLLESIT